MNGVFADTWFFLAVLNPRDSDHPAAINIALTEERHRVTTDWVLVEVGDALSRAGNRFAFGRFYEWTLKDPATTVVPATRGLLDAGGELYRSRLDKDWSLTDCISFVVMADEQIHDALTGDRHFDQAGFNALFK